MVVRQSGPMIDERLLHNSFGVQILLQFVPILLAAGEGQIEAGSGVIGVADMTSDPGFYPALTIVPTI